MSEVGKKYHRLTILETWIESRWNTTFSMATCKCDCGNVKDVRLSLVKSGNTKSCGCYEKELLQQRNWRHGYGKHPLKSTYQSMLRRCNNPQHQSYKHYGGRGIKVCDDWNNDIRSFIKWAENNGYEKGKQLDRIDNNGNYEPNNCRFITVDENHRNMRSNVYIGSLCLVDFLKKISSEHNIPFSTLRYRYYQMKKADIEPTEDKLINYKRVSQK